MDIKIDELLGLMRKRIQDTTKDKFILAANNVLKTIARKDTNLKHRTRR